MEFAPIKSNSFLSLQGEVEIIGKSFVVKRFFIGVHHIIEVGVGVLNFGENPTFLIGFLQVVFGPITFVLR